MYKIIYPEDLELYKNHQIKESDAQVCDHEIQFRITRKDGTMRWIGHFCKPVYDGSGKFKGTRGSNKDITARKKMEELLVTSNQKYKLLSENIVDGIFICKDGRFEYINNAISHIFGFENKELEGKKLTDLVVSDSSQILENILYSTSLKNKSCTVEVECFKKDQTIILTEIFLNYNATEKMVYGVIHDITERKQLQRNILKATIETEEKERAHFSKELHDGLGPLLSTIKLYLQWSQRPSVKKSRTEIIKNAEVIIEEAITAVREISNKLSPHLLINYGLNAAIKSFVDKFKETSIINVEFKSNFNRRMKEEIEASLYRAVIECVNNSIKYANAQNIDINLEETNNQVNLTYADDGIGFDISETLSKHKGLGLFNLQNRINTIGGKLIMNSKPGYGVEYQFLINIE